jgi:hypothetical protein
MIIYYHVAVVLVWLNTVVKQYDPSVTHMSVFDFMPSPAM